MFTPVKSVVIVAFYLCTTLAINIPQANVPENVCFKQTLSEIIKYEKSVIIIWSHRINDSVKDEILNGFMGKVDFIILNWTFQISNNWHMHRSTVTVFLVASHKTDITKGISTLFNKNIWNSNSKFIVLYLDGSGKNKKSSNDLFIKNIFQTFANFKALNVRIIYNYGEGFDEYTWFPYEDGNCESINNVRLVSECESGNYRNFLKSLDSLRLEGTCSITAAIQPMEPYSFYSKDSGFSNGVEVRLMHEFSNHFNFNLKLQPTFKTNSTKSDQLHEKTSHIASGVRNKIQENLAQSIEFHFDDLTFCVKKSDLIQPWRSFFLVDTWQVWTIAIIGVYVTGATVFLFYKYYHHPENYHYCTGVAFMTLIAAPVPYNPTHGIARIHFGILLIYGLLIVTFLNCYLTTMMQKPHYQYQIHTVEDLMYYEYKILTDLDVIPLNDLGTDKIASYIKTNYEDCYDMVRCLNELFKSTSKVAVIVPQKLAKHFSSKTKLPIFCFSESESFRTVMRAFTLNRSNSFLLKKMNSFIRRAMETGHLQKWERDSIRYKIFEENWEGPVVLTVEHISGALLVYAGGMTLAFLTFIAERMAFKKTSRIWKWIDRFIVGVERVVCVSKQRNENQQDANI